MIQSSAPSPTVDLKELALLILLEVDHHVANRLEEHAEGRWRMPAAD